MSDLVCPYCNSKNESSSIFCMACGHLLLEDTELKEDEDLLSNIILSLDTELKNVVSSKEDKKSTSFDSFVIYSGVIISFFLAYLLIGFDSIYNVDLVVLFFNMTLVIVLTIIIFFVYIIIYAVLVVILEEIVCSIRGNT